MCKLCDDSSFGAGMLVEINQRPFPKKRGYCFCELGIQKRQEDTLISILTQEYIYTDIFPFKKCICWFATDCLCLEGNYKKILNNKTGE